MKRKYLIGAIVENFYRCNMKRKYLIGAAALLLIVVIIIIGNNRKTIIGKWKNIDTEDVYYYIFNKDKTCSYEMGGARLGCTYEGSQNRIVVLYKGSTKENIFEYSFKKNTLIIKDTNGNEYTFIKEK